MAWYWVTLIAAGIFLLGYVVGAIVTNLSVLNAFRN